MKGTTFPLLHWIARPATGGLCCFWASLSPQNGKARPGNRTAWVWSLCLCLIRVEPNFGVGV